MSSCPLAEKSNLPPISWCRVIAVTLAVFFPCLLRAQPSSGGCETVIAALKNAETLPPHSGLQYPTPQNSTNWGCYEQQARQGDVMAEYIVGEYYFYGAQPARADQIKIPQDYVKARMWLEEVAGHVDGPTGWPVAAQSQLLLGRIYQHGLGTPADLHKALAWYEKSATQGNSAARTSASKLDEQLSASPVRNGSGAAASNRGSPAAQSTTQPLSPQPTASTDVIAMLQNAVKQKVEFTSDEIRRIAAVASASSASPYDSNAIKKVIRNCNDAAYVLRWSGQPAYDAAGQCGLLAEWGLKSLGLESGKVELAYQRACAIPRATGLLPFAAGTINSTRFGNFCAELGDFYSHRNDTNRALAVYQSAPNCHPKGFHPDHFELFDTACPLAAEQILKIRIVSLLTRCASGSDCSAAEINEAKQSDREVDARMHELCASQFASGVPNICLAHLNQQEKETAGRYQEQAYELRHERAAEEDSARVARERAHDANIHALVGAIQNLPGGSDPNAIVDTANQQAANMIALGAANDAARNGIRMQGGPNTQQANIQAAREAAVHENESGQTETQSFGGSPGQSGGVPAALPSSTPANEFCAGCFAPPAGLTTCVKDAGVDPTSGSHVFENVCTEGIAGIYADVADGGNAVTPLDIPPGGRQEAGGFNSGPRPYKLFLCPADSMPFGPGSSQPNYNSDRYECARVMNGTE